MSFFFRFNNLQLREHFVMSEEDHSKSYINPFQEPTGMLNVDSALSPEPQPTREILNSCRELY